MEGLTPRVRLNEEVRTYVEMAESDLQGRDTVLLTRESFEASSGFKLDADEEGMQHATAMYVGADDWLLTVKTSLCHPDAVSYFEAGCEFLGAARDSLFLERYRVAWETAYSAVELLARAEMLACAPTIDRVVGAKRHGAPRALYNVWGRLGNTDPRFVETYNKLDRARPTARYLNGDANLEFVTDELALILDVLDDLADHAEHCINDEDTDRVPTHFNHFGFFPGPNGEQKRLALDSTGARPD